MRSGRGMDFNDRWCKHQTIFLIGKFGERDLVKPSKFNVLCALLLLFFLCPLT